MADDMTVRIGGDALGAQQAAGVAAASLNDVGTVAQRVAATIAQSFQQAGGAVGSLVQANGTAVQSMQDMGAAANSTMGNGPGGLGSLFSALGQAVGEGGMAFDSFAGKVLGAINPLNMLHSHIVQLLEVMAMWRLMEGGLKEIAGDIGQIVDLPKTGQYQEMAWKYQYGGGAKGQAMAQQVMGWTFNESLNMPYKRQDMNSAISVLNTLGLSPAGIEKYLPVIADIAASAGTNMYGQPITLQQAAMSIMGAGMGYTRMLKYDLKINPEELVKYGYTDTGNMAELMSALQKYAQAHGRIGAAMDLAHNTLQGGMTSVQDRVQNFMIAAGGMTMSGATDPKGLLQGLMDTMNMFTGLTDARVYSGTTYRTAAEQKRGDALEQAIQDAVYKYGAGSTQAKAARAASSGYAHAYGTSNEKEAEVLQQEWLAAVRKYGAADARAKKAHTAYDDFNTEHSNVNIKAGILGVAQIISHDLFYALSDGRDALLAFTKGLKATGLLDLIGRGFNNFSNWLQSPQTHQALTAAGQLGGQVVGGVLNDTVKAWNITWAADIKPSLDNLAKAFKVTDVKNAGSFVGGALAGTVGFLGYQFAGWAHMIQDFMDLVHDLGRADWGAAVKDLGLLLWDLFNNTLMQAPRWLEENVGPAVSNWFTQTLPNAIEMALVNALPQLGYQLQMAFYNLWVGVIEFIDHLPIPDGMKPKIGAPPTPPSLQVPGGQPGGAGGGGGGLKKSALAPYLSAIPGGDLGGFGPLGAVGPAQVQNHFYINGLGLADVTRLIDDVANNREHWGGQVMHAPGGFRTFGQVGGAFGT